MLLVDDIVFAPVRGILWIFREIRDIAQEELDGEAKSVTEQLRTLYMQLETGRITEAEFEAGEKELLDRLEKIESRRTEENEAGESDEDEDDENEDESDEDGEDEDGEDEDEDEDAGDDKVDVKEEDEDAGQDGESGESLMEGSDLNETQEADAAGEKTDEPQGSRA
jgi:hypothetical protein